jgi:hypothetical protein
VSRDADLARLREIAHERSHLADNDARLLRERDRIFRRRRNDTVQTDLGKAAGCSAMNVSLAQRSAS